MKYSVILIVILQILMPVALAGQPLQAAVRISHPVNNTIVDNYQISLEGTSSGLDIKTPGLFIAVHPLLTDKWWIQPLPVVDTNGNWKAAAYLGTQDNGNDQDYSVKVFVTTEKLKNGDVFMENELPPSSNEAVILLKRHDKSFLSALVSSPMFIATGSIVGLIGVIFTIIFGIRHKKG